MLSLDFADTAIIETIATAKTIIPIPPNHCKRERQIKIPSDKLSKLDITVDPVVVIPLTDSKKAFVKLSDELEYINGNEPKRAIINQDKIVNKKACLRLIFNFSFLKPT